MLLLIFTFCAVVVARIFRGARSRSTS